MRRKTELKFFPLNEQVDNEKPAGCDHAIRFQKELNEGFTSTPYFNLQFTKDGAPVAGSFFLNLQDILDAGEACVYHKYFCIIGVKLNKNGVPFESSNITQSELRKYLSELFEISKNLYRITCQELKLGEGSCFSLLLEWQLLKDYVFKSLLDNYGHPARSKHHIPTGRPEPWYDSKILDIIGPKIYQRLKENSPLSVDLKIPIGRLISAANLSGLDVDFALYGDKPAERVVYASDLGNEEEDFNLFTNLCRPTTNEKLFSLKPILEKGAGVKDSNVKSNWDKSGSKPTGIGIYSLGRGIFDAEESVKYIFSSADFENPDLHQFKAFTSSKSLSDAILELLVNGFCHGLPDADYHSTRSFKGEYWYAHAIAIGNFCNRIEVMNIKTNNIIHNRRANDLFGIHPFRSPIHNFLKDLGYAHGRSIGHYLVRYRLKQIMAPMPLYLDGGSTYRAILPKKDLFSRFYTVSYCEDQKTSHDKLNRAFILKVLLATYSASIFEVSSALEIPAKTVEQIINVYRKQGVVAGPKDFERDYVHNFSRLYNEKYKIVDKRAAIKEAEQCLEGFSVSRLFDFMLPQDLLGISKKIIPPNYSTQEDFLNTLRYCMLRKNYSREEVSEILQFATEVFRK